MKYITVLFQKHKKHLPKRLQGTWFGEFCRYGFMIFLSAWILQGIRIMNWREATVKILITAGLTVPIWLLGSPILLSLIIAHTLNFAFNGQLFAMYTHMGATNVTASHFLNETIKISDNLKNKKYVGAAIAYGSLSRGCFKSTSDIDMRIVPEDKEIDWWKTVFYAVWLRMCAFINGYPLDLYVYSADTCTKRMRSDELPIILAEKNNCMKEVYPDRVEKSQFIEIFTIANIENA